MLIIIMLCGDRYVFILFTQKHHQDTYQKIVCLRPVSLVLRLLSCATLTRATNLDNTRSACFSLMTDVENISILTAFLFDKGNSCIFNRTTVQLGISTRKHFRARCLTCVDNFVSCICCTNVEASPRRRLRTVSGMTSSTMTAVYLTLLTVTCNVCVDDIC